MSSIDAPVVPTNEASSAPRPRKIVFTSGVARRSPSMKHAAGDDEEAAEQHDEGHVIVRGAEQGLRRVAAVEEQHRHAERERQQELIPIRFPEMGSRQRKNRDPEQKRDKWKNPAEGGYEGRGRHAKAVYRDRPRPARSHNRHFCRYLNMNGPISTGESVQGADRNVATAQATTQSGGPARRGGEPTRRYVPGN